MKSSYSISAEDEVEIMAKLTGFIYCAGTEKVSNPEKKEGSINAIGVLSALTPEYVPGMFSFSVIFSVLDIDVSIINRIRIVFAKVDEDKNLLDTGVIPVPPFTEKEEVMLPTEYRGATMSMDFRNVIFEENGLYSAKVFVNDEFLGDNYIYVQGRKN